nr:MAG TPA: hypothetical protein [Caudoviricetes sp.]
MIFLLKLPSDIPSREATSLFFIFFSIKNCFNLMYMSFFTSSLELFFVIF